MIPAISSNSQTDRFRQKGFDHMRKMVFTAGLVLFLLISCGHGGPDQAGATVELASAPGQESVAGGPARDRLEAGAALQATRRTAVVDVVEQVAPAVVNIATEQLVEVNPFLQRRTQSIFDWFGEPDRSYTRSSLGSGVIIDDQGHVLTNQHVILQGSRITVVLSDKREFEAELVGADPTLDLAVLKIDTGSSLPFVPMGTSSDLMIGESVIAIGNPFGLNHTVTTGVVSATGRILRTEERVYRDFIQTDASINPGNSGGPLLNINGSLIGINTAIYGGNAQNIGFTIPIDRARRIVDDLIRFGAVVPAWLGVEVQDLSRNLAESFDFPLPGGALVSDVVEESPAGTGGLQRGDIITALGSDSVESARDFRESLRGYTADDEVMLTYYRDGEKKEGTVRSTEFPADQVEGELWRRVGFEVIEITPALARSYNLPATDGVAIRRVRENSPAYAIGLDGGDVLLHVDGTHIDKMENLHQALMPALGRGSFTLMVQRGRHRYRGVLEF
jgi:serine protease Do